MYCNDKPDTVFAVITISAEYFFFNLISPFRNMETGAESARWHSVWRMVSKNAPPQLQIVGRRARKIEARDIFEEPGIRSLILTIPSNRRWHIPPVPTMTTHSSASSFSLPLYSLVYVSHFDSIGL